MLFHVYFLQNQLNGSLAKVNPWNFVNVSTSLTAYNSFNSKIIKISNKHYVYWVISVPKNNHDWLLTFSSVILVALDILFVAGILFVVGEAILFLRASMPACGDAIRFLTVSAPACGDAIRSFTIVMPALRLSNNLTLTSLTSCRWSIFHLFLVL